MMKSKLQKKRRERQQVTGKNHHLLINLQKNMMRLL